MAKEPPPTVGDLRRKAIVTDDEISNAADSFLADPKTTPYRFGRDHMLDVAAAVERHTPSLLIYRDPHACAADKRRAVVNALLLASPMALATPTEE
ncbi:hypothetical protein [Methylobacterium persicinum]|uniref:Uncharacterized protein n=1 Tax=Methylobacterium persicinum TaxID=374426 RepID=A0ABU0HLX4_9HYPH|nr:hypothetical protein [Methylobacterium persicinum]MDQ0442514.1 hypothetical protein [Methylobacterium persicinum]GJE40496.1 hypothetical protein KHHGKMAE_4590 [Methylobacterium persicinum]